MPNEMAMAGMDAFVPFDPLLLLLPSLGLPLSISALSGRDAGERVGGRVGFWVGERVQPSSTVASLEMIP